MVDLGNFNCLGVWTRGRTIVRLECDLKIVVNYLTRFLLELCEGCTQDLVSLNEQSEALPEADKIKIPFNA